MKEREGKGNEGHHQKKYKARMRMEVMLPHFSFPCIPNFRSGYLFFYRYHYLEISTAFKNEMFREFTGA